MTIKSTNQVTTFEASIIESDIEEFILKNPESLNLGLIDIIESQIIQIHKGILDILAFDKETNTYFEIEIMRGKADHWHISHLLDYWAKEQKAKKFSNHVGVLITESCRGRYKTLLSTLTSFLPLIVMEICIIKIDNSENYFMRFEPIFFPDNVSIGIENRLKYKSSSNYILTSKTSMLLIAYFLMNHELVSKTMRDISSVTGISLGQTGNLMQALSEKNFIDSTGEIRKFANINGLEQYFLGILRAFPDRIEYIKEKSKLNIEDLTKKELL